MQKKDMKETMNETIPGVTTVNLHNKNYVRYLTI